MLISFAVTNFRSIKERVQLDLLKTGLKGLSENFFKVKRMQVLKSAVIYGPNASGKSGFLRAFKALEYLVRKSSGFKPDARIAPYEPHRLEKSFASKPVTFEINFIKKSVQYEYIVSFNANTIETEELYYYPNNSKTLLYSRIAGNKEIKFGDYYKGPKKTVEKLLLPNQLFLSKAAENNVEALLDPYFFFSSGLMVYPIMEEYHESNLSKLYARRLAEDNDSKFSKRFNALICALDTGITAVAAEEVDWSNVKFPGSFSEEERQRVQERLKYDIKTKHSLFEENAAVGSETFEVSEESAGTKSLFVIGGIILDALEGGKVLVVDEFEKNLHPSITQYLIKLFHNPLTNPQNAQLVFATHDITQLSNDNFRRDQIWFVEKDEYGATGLIRCSDITGIRLGTPLDKWYVSGRFGATPIINDTDFLIAMQEEDAEA